MARIDAARGGRSPRGKAMPQGFVHRLDLISAEEEQRLLACFADLPFRNFEFHGYFGKRRTVSFGWRYDFTGRGLEEASEIPGFLIGMRRSAARFAGLPPADLQHVLVTEYPAGAGLGWHKDKAVFGEVVGISLLSACTLRFRRKAVSGWERWSLVLEPRSAYLLTGPSRAEWEHSIPAVPSLRYSLTFRTLRAKG
jgi:alkylated DNA repair dioxygenase AlkB